MEKAINLQDPEALRGRRTSARRAESRRKPGACRWCPCHRDGQCHQSSSTASVSRKRRRTAEAGPAERPEELIVASAAHSTNPYADLPVLSTVAPRSKPSTAPLLPDDSPLKIHNLSVEEYQRIYHEVLDCTTKYQSGRPCPYSLELGRRVKQKLWERLNRPLVSTSVGEDGRLDVDVSYGAGVYPPLYDLDVSQESRPKRRIEKSPPPPSLCSLSQLLLTSTRSITTTLHLKPACCI